MSIKFEGEAPFYLGVAETAAAQVWTRTSYTSNRLPL